jgi:hypothetical protein
VTAVSADRQRVRRGHLAGSDNSPMTTDGPRVRFAPSHYAPGLAWSDYQPLLPDWEIVVGDPFCVRDCTHYVYPLGVYILLDPGYWSRYESRSNA